MISQAHAWYNASVSGQAEVYAWKISGVLIGIIAVVFGVLVLVLPGLLQWLVGIFFIVAGLIVIVRRA